MKGPHECFIQIVASPYPSEADKQAAKVLMRHVNRARRSRDNVRKRLQYVEAKLAELEAAMAATGEDR